MLSWLFICFALDIDAQSHVNIDIEMHEVSHTIFFVFVFGRATYLLNMWKWFVASCMCQALDTSRHDLPIEFYQFMFKSCSNVDQCGDKCARMCNTFQHTRHTFWGTYQSVSKHLWRCTHIYAMAARWMKIYALPLKYRATHLSTHTSECGPKGLTVLQALHQITVHIDDTHSFHPFNDITASIILFMLWFVTQWRERA